MLLADPVFAEGALADGKLDAAGITGTLTGKVLAYDDGSTQSFKADGQRVCNKGSDSIGHRKIKGGRDCVKTGHGKD